MKAWIKLLKHANKDKFYWHYIYYALAVFDILVILASLYLNHHVTAIFNDSVRANTVWAERAATLNQLNELATLANAPGNNVFETRNYGDETEKLSSAVEAFLNRLRAFEGEIHENVADTEEFQRPIEAARISMGALAQAASETIDQLQRGFNDIAGTHMAVMDRHYADINLHIIDMSNLVIDKQRVLFQTQLSDAQFYKEFEIVFAVVVTVIVLLITLYGHVLAKKFRLVASEREAARRLHRASVRELEFQKKAMDKHAIVSRLDRSGAITYANDGFCEVTGYSRSEIMGQNHSILNSDEYCGKWFKELLDTVYSGEVWHGTVKHKNKAGGFYWVNSTVVPFMGDTGQPEHFIAVQTDVSEQVLAEQKAEKANKAKSEFLSSMSHELRTPLNSILGFSQLLRFNKQTPLTPRQRESVELIETSGQQLLSLIDQILELSKVESGSLTVSMAKIDPHQTILDCVGLMKTQAQENGISVLYSEPVEASWQILADPLRLNQVLLNLLSNAIKYNRVGGRVSVKTEVREAGLFRIYLSDTGDGISVEQQAYLFEPFNRLGREAGQIEGTGIGLTITKKLVELMGGRIGLYSRENEGATFWIELPLAISDSEAPAPSGRGSAHDRREDSVNKGMTKGEVL